MCLFSRSKGKKQQIYNLDTYYHMAYSNQDIKEKIVELLEEINERYGSLGGELSAEHHSEVLLLAAQAQYLGAHFSALAATLPTIQQADAAVPDTRKKNDAPFTPAIDQERNEVDEQPTEKEIPERENPQKTAKDTSSAERKAEENVDDESLEEVEESPADLPEGEHPEEGTNDHSDPDFDTVNGNKDRHSEARGQEPTSRPYVGVGQPQHTEDSGFTQTETPTDSGGSSQNDQHQKPAETPVDRQDEEVSSPRKTAPVINEVVIEQKSIEIEDAPEPKEQTGSETAPQVEPQTGRPMTVNEMIQQQKKAGLTNVNQFNTSVERGADRNVDLKTAVSLNDKLLFIKDLFNGYSLAYSEAVELLNRFDNFAEADAFLQSNYALKNNWAGKPQTADKLYSILRKKYG